MKTLRSVLLIVGVLLTLSGLIWAAQGAGLFPYPKESFMVGARPWVGYGLGTALIGAILIFLSRKK
jgi:hypothetical protein